MSTKTQLAAHIEIAGRKIGPGEPCFVVAEIAQAHDGSLGTAHAYIDAVARAGADAIKFQTHIAAAESTRHEPWRIKFSPQDELRYDYWRRMEFTEPQWIELAEHTRAAGLVFLSSAFSAPAVELLASLDMPAWKVASGEVGNLPLLRQMAATGKPVLLSSGMSDWAELDRAVEVVAGCGAPVALFQTTTSYPAPANKLGLNVLAEMRRRYGCPVGLSDHSATIYAGLAAAALGADLLEVHVVLSRECFGPDTSSSVTTAELGELVRGTRFIAEALAHPVDKDSMAADLAEVRRIFGKSVVATRPLPGGHVVTADDIALKKPGTGIPAARAEEVLGRTLNRAVEADALLSEDDFV